MKNCDSSHILVLKHSSLFFLCLHSSWDSVYQWIPFGGYKHTHTHTYHTWTGIMASMYTSAIISPNSLLYNLIFLFLLKKHLSSVGDQLFDQYVFVFINRWIYWWITLVLEILLHLCTFLACRRFENRPWGASLVHKITWYFNDLKQFSSYSCSVFTSSFHSLVTNSMLTMFMSFVTSYS